MGEHIFVSSARSDGAAIAGAVGAQLEADGWAVRTAQAGLLGRRRAHEAIRGCRAFLLVLTAHAIRTGSPCLDELAAAVAADRPVVALRPDPTVPVPDGVPAADVVDAPAEVRERLAALYRPSLLAGHAPPLTAPPELVGRDAVRDELDAHLRAPGVRLVAVVGPAGIGKTALVCHLLQGRTAVHLGPAGELPLGWPRLFDGLCRLLPDADAERLTGRLRNPRETPTVLVRALLEALPDAPVAVLLDGAENLAGDTPFEEALQALLTAPRHPVMVVVTARTEPEALVAHAPDAARLVELDGLSPESAAELLRALDPDRDPAAPGELAHLDGCPRAVEALAAVRVLTGSERVPRDPVDAAFEALDPVARQVVAALAATPVPVSPAGVDHVLAAFDPEPSAPVLRRLAELRLVRCVDGHYAVHESDRERVLADVPVGNPADRGLAQPPFTRNALWHRAGRMLAAASSPGDLAPHLAEFELRWVVGDLDRAAEILADGVVEALRSAGHHRLTATLLDRVRGQIDVKVDSWCRVQLGLAHAGLGQPNRAVEQFERARELTPWDVDPALWSHLGHCHAELGRLRSAAELHARAGARRDQAWCLVELGEPEAAVPLLERALASAPDEIDTRAVLGSAHAVAGDLAKAVEQHERGLELAGEAGDRRGEARHRTHLGRCRLGTGELTVAADLLREAAELDRAVGDRAGEAAALAELARCRLLQGRPSEAIELAGRAAAAAEEAGDLRCRATCQLVLGDCQRGIGHPVLARDHYRQAIELADATGCARVRVPARLGLAGSHLDDDDFAAADPVAAEVAELAYPPSHAEVALLAGAVALGRGDPGTAAGHLRRALARADARLGGDLVEAGLLDVRALARTGLAAAGEPDQYAEAATAFRAARAVLATDGVVFGVLGWLDALAPPDEPTALDHLRPIAAGRDPETAG